MIFFFTYLSLTSPFSLLLSWSRHSLLLAKLNMSKELRLKLPNQLFVEVDFAKRASSLVSTPGQNAIAVEKVTNVTGQRNDVLTNLKPLHAKCALITPLERKAVKGGLIETKNGHLALSIKLFLHPFAFFFFSLNGCEGLKLGLSHHSFSFLCLLGLLLFKLL